MRRGIVFGVGLAGVLAAHAGAAAQFAADRRATPPVPQPPPAAPPAMPTFPTAPAAPQFPTGPAAALPVLQAGFTTRPGQPPATATNPATVPWYVKPEHGEWMICVKSYTGEQARQLAEELAGEVRQKYRAAAYLFDRGSEVREKEDQKRAEVVRKMVERDAPFLQEQLKLNEQLKAKAAAQGQEFVDSKVTVRVPKYQEYKEQWAVLVGGFKDMDAARKALDVVRKWEPPAGKHLMDAAVMANRTGAGKEEQVFNAEQAYINPYATALVVPNPAVRHASNGPPPVDPALAKLNQDEPLSLLKARKPWTLLVKPFTMQTKVVTREQEATGVMGMLFGTRSEAAAQLDTTAKQARFLAQGLKHDNMQQSIAQVAPRLGISPRPIVPYVLHIRNGSLVCVGEFDGPNDPALLDTQRLLQWMEFSVDFKDGRPPQKQKMFDNIYPMQIPRPQ